MNTSNLEWRTSRRSGGHSHCVQIAVAAKAGKEVGDTGDRLLLMRDSKDTAGPVLAITPAEWKMFTRRIKERRFCLLRSGAF
jgi:Domain of unknown function (DUF397)